MTDDLQNFGPAMRALTEKQRAFVIAMLTEPFKPAAHWARVAGYTDNGKAGIRVRAHHLVHDERIEAAVAEVCRGTMNILGPVLATQGLIRIARNPKHAKHHWALEKLANRVGFHETTEHKVTVDHGSGGDILQRIRDAASLLGVDPAQLLGANA
jgi:hypothetical protein